jgi:hypothetical protein
LAKRIEKGEKAPISQKPERKKVPATASDLVKSKADYVVEVTLQRGDKDFVLLLKPLSASDHAEIFDRKAPNPPTLLLPKLDNGHVLEGADKTTLSV